MLASTLTSTLLQDGVAAARAGDKELARDRLRDVIRESPQNEIAWIWLAQVAETPTDAVAALEKVLSINHNNLRAHEELRSARLQAGIAAARINQRETARDYLRGVVAADPDREQAWFWLAAVAETPQQSIECLQRVLELSPNNNKARAALRISRFHAGVAEAEAGRHEQARRHLQAVVAEEPTHEAAWHWLSAVAESTADAAMYLCKVLEINPDSTQAWHDLELCERELAAAQNKGKCPFCLVQTGETGSQCTACGAVLSLASPDAFLQNSQVDASRIRQAAARFENATEPGAGHYYLGLAHLNLLEWEPAVRALRAFCLVQPTNEAIRAQFNALLARKQAFLDASLRRRLGGVANTTLESWVGPCVLVADASADVCRMVEEALQWQGFRVVAAANGHEAADRAREQSLDVILIADDLPDLDACDALREGATPIILLTEGNGRNGGSFAGCQDTLAKPIDSTRLLHVVREYTSVLQLL